MLSIAVVRSVLIGLDKRHNAGHCVAAAPAQERRGDHQGSELNGNEGVCVWAQEIMQERRMCVCVCVCLCVSVC